MSGSESGNVKIEKKFIFIIDATGTRKKKKRHNEEESGKRKIRKNIAPTKR
jgi:hypothetical protein